MPSKDEKKEAAKQRMSETPQFKITKAKKTLGDMERVIEKLAQRMSPPDWWYKIDGNDG